MSSETGWRECPDHNHRECQERHYYHGVAYRHATKVKEAKKQLDAGRTVRDYDSDEITKIETTSEGLNKYFYIDGSGTQQSVHMGWPQNLLVQVDEPVTEEELAEVARSIASVRSE